MPVNPATTDWSMWRRPTLRATRPGNEIGAAAVLCGVAPLPAFRSPYRRRNAVVRRCRWRGSSGCPSCPVRPAELRKDAGRLRRRQSRHWSVRRLAPIRERSSWHAALPRRHPQTPRRRYPRISMTRPGNENSSVAWAPKIGSNSGDQYTAHNARDRVGKMPRFAQQQPRRGWKAGKGGTPK